jgi:hypothetical protein
MAEGLGGHRTWSPIALTFTLAWLLPPYPGAPPLPALQELGSQPAEGDRVEDQVQQLAGVMRTKC